MESFAELRQAYQAAQDSRFTPRLTGVNRMGSGADFHYANERHYLHMVERSRDFERNDMIVGQGIRRLVANVMQDGFTPDPFTSDSDLNARLKDKWDSWANDEDACDSEGERTFHDIENLTLHSTIRDGDVWHLLTDEGTMQTFEGHRPRTPRTRKNVVNGVMLDERNRRQQVWLTREDVHPLRRVERVKEVQPYDFRNADGMRQVLQCYFPTRFSQRRGIGSMVPVTDTIGIHGDVQFSTLVKAQLA
ncbi:MAG: phage portal protein, partial [Planctomycetota bacterium]